jgi:hypothetical protein
VQLEDIQSPMLWVLSCQRLSFVEIGCKRSHRVTSPQKRFFLLR